MMNQFLGDRTHLMHDSRSTLQRGDGKYHSKSPKYSSNFSKRDSLNLLSEAQFVHHRMKDFKDMIVKSPSNPDIV
jgi:hypothetical protein